MVAGINGASNSPKNKKKTKDYDPKTGDLKTAWMPFQGQKKEKKKENKGEAGSVGLLMLKRKYTNYRAGGGDLSFEEWRKGK